MASQHSATAIDVSRLYDIRAFLSNAGVMLVAFTNLDLSMQAAYNRTPPSYDRNMQRMPAAYARMQAPCISSMATT